VLIPGYLACDVLHSRRVYIPGMGGTGGGFNRLVQRSRSEAPGSYFSGVTFHLRYRRLQLRHLAHTPLQGFICIS